MSLQKVELIACILYENHKTIDYELALNSVIDYVDKVIVVDGTQIHDGDDAYIFETEKVLIIEHPYDHVSKGGNGAQRNVYLNYCKEHYPKSWLIVLDADEAIDGLQGLRSFLEANDGYDSWSIPMEHFIDNFCNVDNTRNVHIVQDRIFKVSPEVSYPLSEHPVPGPFKNPGVLNGLVYYHFGYAENLFKLRHKFLTHSEKSEMHSKQFLQSWYLSHATGTYPKRPFDISRLPKFIKDYFKLEFVDEVLYFKDRSNVEVKHFEMMSQWLNHFQPKSILEHGCGMGHYLHAARILSSGLQIEGYDRSRYAVENSPYKNEMTLWTYDLTDEQEFKNFDLVLALDVLEHLNYEDLDKALKNIYASGHMFLFSIPYIDDPNLHLDKTHIIKESKEWWISQLEKNGFKVKDVPNNFLFRHQLLEASK